MTKQHDAWMNIPRLDLSKIKRSSWVIDFFLAKGSIQLVYGSFGTRKTTAMLLAAWAVSQGKDFLGMKTKRRCVLYLDYENPPDVLKAYCKDLGIDPSDERFAIWNRAATPIPLPSDDQDNQLEDFVKHCKKVSGHYPWIIFDSWTSLLRAGDSGNDLGDATPIFRGIRRLCDIGCTCTIIDHTGKHGDDPIGTSAKSTQMDTSHYFKAQHGKRLLGSDFSTTVVRVESFLKRYAPKRVGTFSFEVQSGVDRKGQWHLRSLLATKDAAVLKQEKEIDGIKKLIVRNPSLGQEDLAKLAADNDVVSRDRARQWLQDGNGKYWKAVAKRHGKMTFQVL
jgi:AAA domain